MANATKIRIFRMTHFQNLPFILKNGIHAAKSGVKDPNFISIGHRKLIQNRADTQVPVAPFQSLNDYVPFYFCAKTPMLYAILKKRVPDFSGAQGDLIYLVSSVQIIENQGIQFVFSDRHAVLKYAQFFNQSADLSKLDWSAIQSEQWSDLHDPTRQIREQKQAEFLVFGHVPVNCIEGIICQNQNTCTFVEQILTQVSSPIKAVCRPDYYF